MRHRIVEPKRIRRICIEYTGLGIMDSSLYQAVAIGQCAWPVLGYFAAEFTDSGMRVEDLLKKRFIYRVSIHEGEGDTSTVNMCDVVESRIVNLKQWPRYRLGNPSVMFR